MTESTRANGADAADNKRVTRVLVVDDEESNRTFAERGLRGAGYEVAVASDGPEALRIVVKAQRPFDLFVIDILMPQMRGDELARRLRQVDPGLKVLYFTGYPDLLFEDGKVLRAHEAFVEKPVSRKGLLEAVSLILFGHMRGPETDADDIISNGEVFEQVLEDAGYGFAVASDSRVGLRRSVGRAHVNIRRIPRAAGTVSERRTAHRRGTGTIRFCNQGPLGPPLALIGKQLTMRLDDGRTLDFMLCDSGNITAVRVMN